MGFVLLQGQVLSVLGPCRRLLVLMTRILHPGPIPDQLLVFAFAVGLLFFEVLLLFKLRESLFPGPIRSFSDERRHGGPGFPNSGDVFLEPPCTRPRSWGQPSSSCSEGYTLPATRHLKRKIFSSIDDFGRYVLGACCGLAYHSGYSGNVPDVRAHSLGPEEGRANQRPSPGSTVLLADRMATGSELSLPRLGTTGRFLGSVFETGLRYTLTFHNLQKFYGETFSASYVLPTLWLYLVTGFDVVRKFPFLLVGYGHSPSLLFIGQSSIYHSEDVTSLILSAPIVSFSLISLRTTGSLLLTKCGKRHVEPADEHGDEPLLWIRYLCWEQRRCPSGRSYSISMLACGFLGSWLRL